MNTNFYVVQGLLLTKVDHYVNASIGTKLNVTLKIDHTASIAYNDVYGRYLLIQKYFCVVYEHAGKEDLSMCY